MNKLMMSRVYLGLMRRSMSGQTPAPSEGAAAARDNMAPKYRPTEFQKTILVWTKKYKTKEEIPKYVSPDLIERSRSEARIKIANVLMLLTVLGSIGAIFLGKSAANRGESIHKMNQDFHKQYRENFEKTHSENK